MDRKAGGGPIATLVDLIVGEAFALQAEQIHLDSASGLVRFLRAGSWLPVMKLPKPASEAVLNRLRVVASIDRTGGKRRQERKLKLQVGDTDREIRVVVQYTDDGTEESYLHLPGE